MEQKKIISKGVEEFEGYGADPVPEEGQSLDWSDRLFLDVSEDTRKPSLWPENPSSLRSTKTGYLGTGTTHDVFVLSGTLS